MDLLQCYDKLGLTPECGWRELQSGYRRLVQKWHPDRWQQHPDQQHVAAHRMLEINEAYGILAQYYRQHGELPFEPPRRKSGPVSDIAFSTSASAGDTDADFEMRLRSLQARMGRNRVFDLLPWLIIISICALAYYYFSAYRAAGTLLSDQDVPAATAVRPDAAAPAAPALTAHKDPRRDSSSLRD